jgi:helicase-like protein
LDIEEATEKFIDWLGLKVITAARGDHHHFLEVDPGRRFWLGRLAPESAVLDLGLGERGERLDPCAIGFRLKPATLGPWNFTVSVSACAWLRFDSKTWNKSSKLRLNVVVAIPSVDYASASFGSPEIGLGFTELVGASGLTAEVRVEVSLDSAHHPELTIVFVNTSPKEHKLIADTNLYECSLEVSGLDIEPYVLEALPDSFRYDRRIDGYGINCGLVRTIAGAISSTDAIIADKGRPTYWNVKETQPDLTFDTLSTNPLPSLRSLVSLLMQWGDSAWSEESLEVRAAQNQWTSEMRHEARIAGRDFSTERERIECGVNLLESNPELLKAFKLMNIAIRHAARGRYPAWRPFQIGFLIANLTSVIELDNDCEIADIVWFATGGGKTETYLGLLVLAALFDRLSGKSSGITAWSRFPLRMLSLQQTQRFADAMAGAELVRKEAGIAGDRFAVGFLVGDGATPNQIPIEPKESEPDPDDDLMPARYQVLIRCPFCHQESIAMAFDRVTWQLQHSCTNPSCPWTERTLPFYVVDEEIFRFLPTIIVGTLDKAASISLQAAMHGLIGPPRGRCSVAGHGYTYAIRKARPTGCLVPGCSAVSTTLDCKPERFGPSFRLQDELHLLRDSLGAVDSHYETLFDHLQLHICGRKPKILASSATLTGYEKQIDVLYKRKARVFPIQGPSEAEGFWTAESDQLARRFVALAPRGETLESAVDRIITELQSAIRELVNDPRKACDEMEIDISLAPRLISIYGVNVLYGNTLRDLDAAVRSLETQIAVDGSLNSTTLTGKSEFSEVRQILERLDNPEERFEDRLHVVAASAMMSHGVDVDRLNIMVVLGMPLTTAEFIQATARVGRRWPGLVFVMHKMARERDASVFRSFQKFVTQGDRFVEAIPITRRSRRVLARTIAGVELARILHIHEPRSAGSLTLVTQLRQFFAKNKIDVETELQAAKEALALTEPLDELLRTDLAAWFDVFFRNLEDPGGNFRFPSDLCRPAKPMRSLRDVEEQAPIFGIIANERL